MFSVFACVGSLLPSNNLPFPGIILPVFFEIVKTMQNNLESENTSNLKTRKRNSDNDNNGQSNKNVKHSSEYDNNDQSNKKEKMLQTL